jgi:rhodanese-related sulfurtransferase
MNELINYAPKEAYKILENNKNAVFIDVRSKLENMLARPVNCILIPWVDKPYWNPNEEEFINSVKSNNCSLDTEIILICRSGHRSMNAGECLIDNGFSKVGHVVGGFEGDEDQNRKRCNINGWIYDGLPCEDL